MAKTNELIAKIIASTAKLTDVFEGCELVELFFDLFVTPDTDIQPSSLKVFFGEYSHCTNYQEILGQMDGSGYQPATVFDLLYYVANDRNWNCRCSNLVALGSSVSFGKEKRQPERYYWAQDSKPFIVGFEVMGVCLGNGEVKVYPRLYLTDYKANFVRMSEGHGPGWRDYGFLGVQKADSKGQSNL